LTEAIRNHATHPRRWYNDLTTKEEDNMNINTTVIDSMDIDTLKAALIGVLKGDINATFLGVLNGKKLYPTRTERVNDAGAACMPVFLEAAKDGINAIDLLKVAKDRFNYCDIRLLAKTLHEAGVITESHRGRKATWHLTAT